MYKFKWGFLSILYTVVLATWEHFQTFSILYLLCPSIISTFYSENHFLQTYLRSIRLCVVYSGYVCLPSQASLCEVLAHCVSLTGRVFPCPGLNYEEQDLPCCSRCSENKLFTATLLRQRSGTSEKDQWHVNRSSQLFWPWLRTPKKKKKALQHISVVQQFLCSHFVASRSVSEK